MQNKILEVEKIIGNELKKIDEIAFYNSNKVINAFWQNKVSESHFSATTGYGYGDVGRETLEKVYSDIFKAEDALVRNQFISGTHAISTALFAILRPKDTMLSITGKPYDTLDSVIGFNDNASSLRAFDINYDEVDLIGDDFDYEKIKEKITSQKIKLVTIQRSKGYSLRKSISLEKLEKVIKYIKNINQEIIIMIDNCYCEFVNKKEPIEVGADLCIGSLIKNPGGFIATNGAYIVGKKELIHLCSERLNVAGEAKEVGPSLGATKSFFQGLYLAPSVVANSLKTSIFAAYILENKGYKVEPKWNEKREDIVQMIIFNEEEKLIKFIQGIQMGSAIDSFAIPEPTEMPGYDDKIIMASGSFTQGSSIELSCDGPIRPPYVAYLQGSVTYEYGKIGILKAIENVK